MIKLIHGDCLEEMKKMESNSVDSICCDPPYGLSFMGKKWDYDVPSEDIWRECLRVLKPGGHLLAFAGTRTQHRMAVRIEDAGFEIRDMIAWTYGVGFPKSLNVRLNIDKQFDILKGICNQLPASVVAESFIEAPLISNEECFVIEPAAPTSQPQEQSAKYVVKNSSKRTAKSRNPSIIIAEGCVRDLLKESLVDKTKGVAALKTLLGKWLSLNETDTSANFAELIESLKLTILKKLETFPNFDTNSLTECVFAIHVTTTQSIKECLISNTVDILKEVNKELHDGIGTALKPALEPITVARKPLIGTVAENVLTHGTGGINISACRVVSPALVNEDSIGGTSPLHTSGQTSDTQNTGHQEMSELLPSHQNGHSSTPSSHAQSLTKSQDLTGHCLACSRQYDEQSRQAITSDQEIAPSHSDAHELPCRLCAEKHNPLNQSTSYIKVKDNTNSINIDGDMQTGRWPSNLIHDGSEEVVGLFPANVKGEIGRAGRKSAGDYEASNYKVGVVTETGFKDSGSAARFFYCAKAGKKDRDEGLDAFAVREAASRHAFSGLPDQRMDREQKREGARNHHPTVKPTDLMRYLCRLVTPPNGIVLDPFMGSGSTGKAAKLEGFSFIGIEREAEYIEIARARIDAAQP